MNRRDFLKAGLTVGAGLLSGGLLGEGSRSAVFAQTQWPDIVVVHGSNPANMVRVAVQTLGGISRFIPSGAKVVMKPNASFARPPEGAANTHPLVVKTMCELAKAAKAKRVIALDRTLAEPTQAVAANQIKAAAESAGAEWLAPMERAYYKEVSIPRGRKIKSDMVQRDVLDADVLINLPIAKHHGGSTITIGMKNCMGVNWNRGSYHSLGLHECIVDLNTVVRAKLTLVDCFRVLVDGGPGGPGQIREPHILLAGTDPVALDCYACRYLYRDPNDILHLTEAARIGLGQFDLTQLRIVSVEA